MGLIADALARQHTGLREFGQFASECVPAVVPWFASSRRW